MESTKEYKENEFKKRLKCKKCAHFGQKCLEFHPKDTHFYNDSLCWCCRKSLTDECVWHRNHIPILGWVADKHKLHDKVTYNVKSCPDFERG